MKMKFGAYNSLQILKLFCNMYTGLQVLNVTMNLRLASGGTVYKTETEKGCRTKLGK